MNPTSTTFPARAGTSRKFEGKRSWDSPSAPDERDHRKPGPKADSGSAPPSLPKKTVAALSDDEQEGTMTRKTKRPSRKESQQKVSEHQTWTVWRGKLVPSKGRPDKVNSLFCVVAEKIPYPCLSDVEQDMDAEGLSAQGIYLAHDSMGHARYAGRGSIFGRLKARRRTSPLELHYFSFYVISDKKHEREIETAIIRAASPLLEFNDRKKPVGIDPGNIRDYEGGTYFYERQNKKGKKKRKKA